MSDTVRTELMVMDMRASRVIVPWTVMDCSVANQPETYLNLAANHIMNKKFRYDDNYKIRVRIVDETTNRIVDMLQ